MAESNWQTIDKAPRGIGPVLLRANSDILAGACIGYQDDAGQWVSSPGVPIVPAPAFWCRVPQFDCETRE